MVLIQGKVLRHDDGLHNYAGKSLSVTKTNTTSCGHNKDRRRRTKASNKNYGAPGGTSPSPSNQHALLGKGGRGEVGVRSLVAISLCLETGLQYTVHPELHWSAVH